MTTLANLIFDICLAKFKRDRYTIQHHRKAHKDLRLADIDEDFFIIHVYPHKGMQGMKRKSLFHELLHLGLDLNGDFDTNGTMEDLENIVWREINGDRRDKLSELLKG